MKDGSVVRVLHDVHSVQRCVHEVSFNLVNNLIDVARRSDDCEPAEPADTTTDRLNALLQNSGPGYILKLCSNQTYLIQAPLVFGAANQEISTLGYPTGDERALIVVNGTINDDGTGHTTAVDGTCISCSGLKLRNVQVGAVST